MNKFAQLASDIVKLWTKYGSDYISGIENTLILALTATLIGCVIGFVCGVIIFCQMKKRRVEGR